MVVPVGAPVGLGCMPEKGAAGYYGGGFKIGPASTVYDFLAAGSPQLALAKALSIPFQRLIFPIEAEFPDPSPTGQLNVVPQFRIEQDTLITGCCYRILNEGTPNVSTLSTLSDFFFNYQSGIQCVLDVTGRPGYPVVPDFTDLSTVCDALGGSDWNDGWILNYTSSLKMSFIGRIALPTSPMLVTVSWRAWVPAWEELVRMTNFEAIKRLNDLGIETGERFMCGVEKLAPGVLEAAATAGGTGRVYDVGAGRAARIAEGAARDHGR
jgi:hypothetical protein